ncbi:MAG: sugar phosphate isomerase/epimerase family protein [Desulfonatronovibrionaceae bacterium]
MTEFFVNLPLSYIETAPSHFDLFVRHELSPELGLDAGSIDEFGSERHARCRQAVSGAGVKTSVHFPFMDLRPGSPDRLIRQASLERLEKAVQVALPYSPSHVIVHSGYVPGVCDENYSSWLENSVETWIRILDRAPELNFYLENVYEQDPVQVKDLLAELGGRLGFCFDIGHWHSFGRGSLNRDLPLWLQNLGPYLGHLHLHDNEGEKDQHLGLGSGKIPFVELFAGLEFLDLSPTFTLEPHSLEDFVQSLNYILKHKYWFSRLNLRRQDFDHLQQVYSALSGRS